MARTERKPGKIDRLNSEQGSVMVIGINFLLILTLLGMAGMQGSILEERMAGHTRDRELAFRAAEAALRMGEQFLAGPELPAFTSAPDGLYQMDGTLPDTLAWDDADSREYDSFLAGLAENPRYIIEELPPAGQHEPLFPDEPMTEGRYYRVTARGVGGTSSAVVILQSVYRR
jgi:type IV pilus assembly protein PilX